jgi:hypothetical protein
MNDQLSGIETSAQEIAEFVLSNTLELQNRLIDEISAAFRWLMASLLAVNGGSALALLSSDSIERCGVIVAGALFTIGTFSALLLGFFTLKSAERAIQPISSMVEFWLTARHVGEFEQAELETRTNVLEARLRPTKIASYLTGVSSAICFLLGTIAIGLNLK